MSKTSKPVKAILRMKNELISLSKDDPKTRKIENKHYIFRFMYLRKIVLLRKLSLKNFEKRK